MSQENLRVYRITLRYGSNSSFVRAVAAASIWEAVRGMTQDTNCSIVMIEDLGELVIYSGESELST